MLGPGVPLLDAARLLAARAAWHEWIAEGQYLGAAFEPIGPRRGRSA